MTDYLVRLDDVKRHQRDLNLDPVQLKIDRDWLVGQLEETLLQLRDLKRGVGDVLASARDAAVSMYATEELARMILTNQADREVVS